MLGEIVKVIDSFRTVGTPCQSCNVVHNRQGLTLKTMQRNPEKCAE
jgi:hypothetical protein